MGEQEFQLLERFEQREARRGRLSSAQLLGYLRTVLRDSPDSLAISRIPLRWPTNTRIYLHGRLPG